MSDFPVDARIVASIQLKSTHTSRKYHVSSQSGKLRELGAIQCSRCFWISRRLIPQQRERGGKRDSRRETRRRAVASVQSAVRYMRKRTYAYMFCAHLRMHAHGDVRSCPSRGYRTGDTLDRHFSIPVRTQQPPHILPAFHHLPIGFALRLDSARIVKTEQRNPMANICSPNTTIFSRNSRRACTLPPLAEYGALKIIERTRERERE